MHYIPLESFYSLQHDMLGIRQSPHSRDKNSTTTSELPTTRDLPKSHFPALFRILPVCPLPLCMTNQFPSHAEIVCNAVDILQYLFLLREEAGELGV